MPAQSFFKKNFVLIVGLTLPVLLIVGFLVASNLPESLSDPPKYDLVFATTDYPPNANSCLSNANNRSLSIDSRPPTAKCLTLFANFLDQLE